MKRRYVMWCLAALALVLLIAGRTRAEAATGSGSCGEGLTWELNASGVLTIRGNGAMDKSYYSANPAPWADYTDSIKKVVLEEGVTTVAICGFENLPNLSEVSLPDSLTEIGNAAFQNCPSLAQITIPENVTTMGSNIVTGCTGLRNVYFNAKNLTSGELGRPCDEEAVLTITIGEQVRVIPAWFCRIMKALKKVVIPENGDLTDIGDLAFYECTGLTEINLPANLVNIGYQAFYLCAGLSEIELGDQMTSIGQSCFEGCKGLTEVTIPKNMTKIGAYAFKDCTGIVKLTVEARKLDGCGAYVFCAAGSPSHRMNVVFTDDVTMIPGNFLSARDEGDEVVPFVDTVSLGKNITSIGGSAFYHQKYMTCSGLPGALTSIGSYAFGECNKAFTDIVIPEGVTKIERNTFYCCMSAESVTLPQSLKQIGEKAFCGCTSLKKLEIPAGVTSLGRAFAQNCRSMEELIIRSEKYTLDWNGLYGCSSLKEADLRNADIKSVPYCFFTDCTALEKVYLPEKITKIETRAFSQCSSLKEIAIPENVTEINSEAFEGCASLTEVMIPEKIVSIEQKAFQGCESLSEITIPAGIKKLGDNAFSDCKGLTKVNYLAKNLPDLTTTKPLFKNAGANGTGVDVVIGDEITRIPSWLFNDEAKVKSLVVGRKVEEIGDGAFYRCTGLTEILFKGDCPSFGSNAFYKVNADGTHPLTDSWDPLPDLGANTEIRWNGVPVGWAKENGVWVYYVAPYEKAQGWISDGGKWYYFGEDGAMATGWRKVDGSWYYLSDDGSMVNGWQKIGSSWYFFNGSGVMQTGWKESSGKWYYLKSSGAMAVGWAKVGSSWYYFSGSGVMQTGWKEIGGSWYWFKSSGAMQTGWKEIGGSWYWFKSSGAMATGWQKIGGYWYWFKSSGVMATGSVRIGGKTYRFDKNGRCLNP